MLECHNAMNRSDTREIKDASEEGCNFQWGGERYHRRKNLKEV